ncbi:MAG: hypothetical protein OES09_13490, partial [Gammaproteobacteria bacterium]|nr:hypothetical protein [Gammaproteobacteria bacterium]
MTKQYTMVAVGLAGLLLMAVIVDVVYRFALPVWTGTDSAEESVSDSRRLAPEYQVNVSSIVASHLFGRQQQVVQRQQEAPITRLQLRLLGVMSSPNDTYARALIAVGGDRGEAYRVGDQIANTDAKLHEISSNLVLLDRSGRLERLELIRENVIDAPAGEPQDPSTLPTPSPNDVEIIHEEIEPEIEPEQEVINEP